MSTLALPLTLAAGLGGCVLFLCHAYLPEIKELMSLVSSYLFARLPLAQVSVDANSYASTRITHALREEICLQNNVKNYIARDGGGRPRFSLGDGVYTISFCNAKVAVSVSNQQLKIVSISEPALLKSFLSSLYEKYNRPDEVLCFYLSTGEQWGNAIVRAPRLNVPQTQSIRNLLGDISSFYTVGVREDYEKRGMNYRRGYLLHGEGGTGKTSVIELIASHHRLSCYNIILNAKGMTDATLVNLAATVPPRSLIVFDEFDKEWKTIRETKGKAITEAGLLNAIGGTPPLHAGVIVLILVNDITVFDTPEWSTLLRPGRIDKVFHFTESICG